MTDAPPDPVHLADVIQFDPDATKRRLIREAHELAEKAAVLIVREQIRRLVSE